MRCFGLRANGMNSLKNPVFPANRPSWRVLDSNGEVDENLKSRDRSSSVPIATLWLSSTEIICPKMSNTVSRPRCSRLESSRDYFPFRSRPPSPPDALPPPPPDKGTWPPRRFSLLSPLFLPPWTLGPPDAFGFIEGVASDF